MTKMISPEEMPSFLNNLADDYFKEDYENMDKLAQISAYIHGLVKARQESPTDSKDHSSMKKPPIGLMPRWVHDMQRAVDLVNAIDRYANAGMSIPKEWIDELKDKVAFKSSASCLQQNALSGLLNLNVTPLEVWRLADQRICVAYRSCDVKDGVVLRGEYGCGKTFEEACDDYYKKISGKELIFYSNNGSRQSITVL